MAPFDLASIGTWAVYAVAFVIGIGFGAVLEASGFGDSRKLAAQFYLKDLTVLKVMFTAIIVAAVLIALSSALGLLDFDKVFVNPTYLIPGIVGGLIMGVGFIIGGFCPGTSLVSASTLKIDGIFFVGGVMIGVFLFGETVYLFDGFWISSLMGRFTLPDLLGLPTGVVVLLVVLMAVGMFAAGEWAERRFGGMPRVSAGRFRVRPGLIAAGALVALTIPTILLGPASPLEKWDRLEATEGLRLTNREVQASPMELAELMRDPAIVVRILDMRDEIDFNLFHIKGAARTTIGDLMDQTFIRSLRAAPANNVIFLVSNGEADATTAWKVLRAENVPNIYILERGMNHWLEVFQLPPCVAKPLENASTLGDEELHYAFNRSVGDCCNTAFAAIPDLPLPEDCQSAAAGLPSSGVPHVKAGVEFEHKVKLQKKASAKGGCS